MRIVIIFLFCFIILSCGKGDLEKANIHFQKAKTFFFERSDFENAEIELKTVLELVPEFESVAFNFMHGYLYQKKHLYEEAIKKYLQELKISQKNQEIYKLTLLNLAQTYFSAGIFYKALFDSTVNAHLNYYNCRLYLLDKTKVANLEQDGLILHEPNIDFLFYFRGICYYLSGNFQKAIEDFNRVKNKLLYWSARIHLGACYCKKGFFPDATQYWDDVCKNNKNNPEILSELNYIYTQLDIPKKLEEAVKDCEKIYRESKSKEVAKYLMWTYFKNNQLDKATKLMQEVKFKIPDLTDKWGEYRDIERGINVEYTTKFYNPLVIDHKADIYLYQAIRYYKEYLKFEPEDKITLCQIGISQLNSNQLNLAIDTLEKVLYTDDKNIRLKAKINLGTAYYLVGQAFKAEKLWEEVKNETDNSLIRSDLGITYAKLGIKLDEALSLCYTEKVKKPGILSWNLGKVYFKKGINDSNREHILNAMMHYEKNHIQESGYSVELNDPVLLLDLTNTYYNRHLFRVSSEIMASLRDYYPEAEQMFNSVQAVAEIWQIIKWDKKLDWEIEWF